MASSNPGGAARGTVAPKGGLTLSDPTMTTPPLLSLILLSWGLTLVSAREAKLIVSLFGAFLPR